MKDREFGLKEKLQLMLCWLGRGVPARHLEENLMTQNLVRWIYKYL